MQNRSVLKLFPQPLIHYKFEDYNEQNKELETGAHFVRGLESVSQLKIFQLIAPSTKSNTYSCETKLFCLHCFKPITRTTQNQNEVHRI